ncbi:MAG: N-acetyl-gamma-glutamyl-phosphate reductase [Betaproteobacteria bacterium]|jgi:N-acetyl-gamma-glutamyl-phosphate reductase|nr:MAG: N-acetyl-gamma-glutamyl-phosphate reductase [Betaproteobacteria bacterium SG8_41]UCF76729.1 MAG: N-acetyl-gamma-glutamyl-phosphate reductase [Betaproteobacteria bacterium]
MAKKGITVGIVGGTGYTGVELLRLLVQHPQCELRAITSRKEAGMGVAELFPNLRGRIGLKFSDPAKAELAACDLVFFATPNGVAMEQARALLNAGVRIIDVAADFRIKDVALWEQWYGVKHACPELVAEAVYGLPEIHRERIREARLVANPGCYPTAVQLGFLPLVEAGIVDIDRLIADAKSGVSGAGRKAEVHTLLAEASDNFKAYGVTGHRHLPEITQGLSAIAGRAIGLVFVPHLTPMIRGIHATLYARLTSKTDLQALYESRFAQETFVDVMPAGSHPDTRSVRGANSCRIAVHQPRGGDTVVVLSVIDNLVKGASGQAIQNMNIMFGFHESTGLEQLPLLP